MAFQNPTPFMKLQEWILDMHECTTNKLKMMIMKVKMTIIKTTIMMTKHL